MTDKVGVALVGLGAWGKNIRLALLKIDSVKATTEYFQEQIR